MGGLYRSQYTGSVVDLLASRKGQMLDMNACDARGQCTVKYKIPTRGLIGLRNQILTATRGTGILNTIFMEYAEWAGDMLNRDNGSLVAHETGEVTGYALFSSQERGTMLVKPGQKVYAGQVVGIHQRAGDLKVNVCKKKAATNVRSNKDATVVLNEPKVMSLDDAVEYLSVRHAPCALRALPFPLFPPLEPRFPRLAISCSCAAVVVRVSTVVVRLRLRC